MYVPSLRIASVELMMEVLCSAPRNSTVPVTLQPPTSVWAWPVPNVVARVATTARIPTLSVRADMLEGRSVNDHDRSTDRVADQCRTLFRQLRRIRRSSFGCAGLGSKEESACAA